MPARDELSGALLECLRDVSSLARTRPRDRGLDSRTRCHASDAEEIAATCLSQEEVLRKIAQADERAAAVAAGIAEQNGLDVETADAAAIAQAAGAPYDCT